MRPATGADPRHLDHDGDTLTTSASPWLRNPNLPARNARICIVTQRDVAMVIERGRLQMAIGESNDGKSHAQLLTPGIIRMAAPEPGGLLVPGSFQNF